MSTKYNRMQMEIDRLMTLVGSAKVLLDAARTAITQLSAENADLRTRLDKPCKGCGQ